MFTDVNENVLSRGTKTGTHKPNTVCTIDHLVTLQFVNKSVRFSLSVHILRVMDYINFLLEMLLLSRINANKIPRSYFAIKPAALFLHNT